MDKIEEILTRGVANIISSKQELEKLLRSDKKLHIYLGIDPTSTKIHLGHAVALRKLEAFANLGHHVTFLIGDFTALIGDTSDKESERPVLTTEEIEKNFQTYKKQAEKILDFTKVTIRHNIEWLKKLQFEDIVKLTQQFSLNDFISRELIKKRLTEGKRIGLHEVLYPIMQAYDSYELHTDLQIGGTDQTFNIQAGRNMIRAMGNRESFVLTTPILEGTDGRKMSKSWGNAIWLDDTPDDVYAKVMAINDSLIVQYYTLATNVPMEEISGIEKELEEGINPMLLKKKLAAQIVSELHDADAAEKAGEHFVKTVQEKETPEEMQTITLLIENQTVVDILVETGLAASKSDAKRLVEQGGVRMNEILVNNASQPFHQIAKQSDVLIQVGKRKFVKVTLKQ